MDFYNSQMFEIPYQPQYFNEMYDDSITNTLSYLNYKYKLDYELSRNTRNYFCSIFRPMIEVLVPRAKPHAIAAAIVFCLHTNNINDVINLSFEIFDARRSVKLNNYLLKFINDNKVKLNTINIRKSEPIDKTASIAEFIKSLLKINYDGNVITGFLRSEFENGMSDNNISLFKFRMKDKGMYEIIKMCYFILGDGRNGKH